MDAISCTWDASRAAAMELGPGWDLATVASAAESEFLKSLLTVDSFNLDQFTTNSSGPWIGGLNVFGPTEFQWVTEEPVTFTDWGPSEPFQNTGLMISYADFTEPFGDLSGIAWNDVESGRPAGDGPIAFIAESAGPCEVVPTPTATPTPTPTPTSIPSPVVHGPFGLADWPEAIQLNDFQDRAYIPMQESGLDIHDVSDRDAATWLANFVASSECSSQPLFADEVALVEDDGAVDAIISGGECGVVGVDVTDSSNPIFIDRIPIPFGLAEETAFTESANGQDLILYVASFWQGLQIFEVVGDCNPSSCTVVPRGSIGADDEWGASLAVWVEIVFGEGEVPQILAYVASTEGLQIVDVSNPDAPTLLGRLDTNPTDIPLDELDDVPQDVVVSGGLAFVPIWIGGLIVVDVQNPTNPTEFQRIAASAGSAFFKVEVSSRDNRIYVTEGIDGVAVFRQLDGGQLSLEERFPIGVGDPRCSFSDGVSDICWAWGIDEQQELLGVTYGVLDSPLGGGFQLISMPLNAVDGTVLRTLQAVPVPEPHPLLLQGVGALALAGLDRLRRRRRRRPARP